MKVTDRDGKPAEGTELAVPQEQGDEPLTVASSVYSHGDCAVTKAGDTAHLRRLQ
ncbi:MAG: hypothetical protein AB8H80_23960 [Planctomycetota bacterium]